MKGDREFELCVIGAGSAGLAIAAAAAGLGIRVALIERERMGGECLNTGCVPSKALLAAARAAHSARQASMFGVDAEVRVDFARVRRHVQEAIKAIAPHDSAERFERMGVEVIPGQARFVAPRVLECEGRRIDARKVVIATGSDPDIPKLLGLERVRYLTNETIFDHETLPNHLAVIGGGPLGIELAQAFRRLGSSVTVLEHQTAMPMDDPELARPLLRRLAGEGIAIREKAEVQAVEQDGDGVALTVKESGQTTRLHASHVLVAVGRAPRVTGMDLEQTGVRYSDRGIAVDARLRTSARGVYACGDVVEGPRFTHVCTYHAGIVIRNALFHVPARINYASLPWVTYTDPELAQVGMTEQQARERHGDDVQALRAPYEMSDRAQVERQAEGLLKLVARKNGRVLGASIFGAHAGELAPLWVLAIERGLRLRHLAQMIAPYPTWGELDKTVAANFMKPRLFGGLVRSLVPLLSRLP